VGVVFCLEDSALGETARQRTGTSSDPGIASGPEHYGESFGDYPPVQLDGNFRITAGIEEMLLQSQTNTIELLPALPRYWQAGDVTGLRGRGDYTIDTKWSGGRLSSVLLRGKQGRGVRLRYGQKTNDINHSRKWTCASGAGSAAWFEWVDTSRTSRTLLYIVWQ
jgi:hypothetical protein